MKAKKSFGKSTKGYLRVSSREFAFKYLVSLFIVVYNGLLNIPYMKLSSLSSCLDELSLIDELGTFKESSPRAS